MLERDPRAGPAIAETFDRRWRCVLAVTAHEGHRDVLLGAWGCGAFRNDPDVVSESAARALDSFSPTFDLVVFAIPGQGRRSRLNLESFRSRFSAKRPAGDSP